MFDGPRGKWLCYFCKVVKVGIDFEHTVTALPNEKRVLACFEGYRGWRQVSQGICEILSAYPCASSLMINDLNLDELKSWEEFVSTVMKRVPSDGGNKAYFVLRLFEAIVESDIVFAQTK